MPFRASITGIDGTGKDSVTDLAAELLGKEYDIVKVTPPVYSIRNGNKTFEFSTLLNTYDLMNEAAVRSRSNKAILFVNAVYVLLQTRIIEPSLVERYQPDVVIGARDMLVDPAVYASYYAKGTLGAKNERGRILTMHRLTKTPFRDSITLLTAQPRTALERIRHQMTENNEESHDTRKRLLYAHEDHENLRLLAQSYNRVLDVLRTIHPTPVLEISTDEKTQDDVALIIVSHILLCANHEIPPELWSRI